MRIGIKYCGGCNPRYDRTGLVDRLKSEPDFARLEWVHATASDAPLDFVLVVCGCTVACAEHKNLSGMQGKFVIHAQEQYALVLEHLKQLRQAP